MSRLRYRKLIRGLSAMGVTHSNMSRMFGVSITIIRYIVEKAEYKPTERIQARIINKVDDLLILFQV